jgi:hypothetical protein
MPRISYRIADGVPIGAPHPVRVCKRARTEKGI